MEGVRLPCLEPGCPEMALPGPRHSRCREHQRARDRVRSRRPERRIYQTRQWKAIPVRGQPCALAYPGICTGWATVRDHIIPKAAGGSDDASNVQPACAACNGSKGAKIAEELRARESRPRPGPGLPPRS
ncbi:MAG: HNH endonuclease [Jiangellaceae bacterium]